MRLKTFFAPCLQEAMTQVRRELGGEAIIISTLQERNGVRVTAALENQVPKKAGEVPVSKDHLLEELTRCLSYHGVPSPLKERLVAQAEVSSATTLSDASKVWDSFFTHDSSFDQMVSGKSNQCFLLAGTPGAGKSVTLAKLAVEALLEKKKVQIVTLDEGKAGALEQLSAYASHLKLEVQSFSSPEELNSAVNNLRPKELLLIDTPGINPFSQRDIEFLSQCIFATQCVPHWVFPAGCDVWEAIEMAEVFKELGVRDIFHTRGDVARRHGALLAVLANDPFRLMGMSQGPTLAQRLVEANSTALHDLLKSTFFVQSFQQQENTVPQVKQAKKTKEIREPIWIARLREAKG